MLLTFHATNARSFRDELDLSFLWTRLGEPEVARNVPWREGGGTVRVVPVVGIFGANASGKTNVLRVMHDMRVHVLDSFKRGDPQGGIDRRAFRLGKPDDTRSTKYEISLSLAGIKHDYGFELDDERIRAEWAIYYPKGKAATLFLRDGDEMYFGGPVGRSDGRALTKLLRSNALFLSTAAAASYEPLLPLYSWFVENLHLAEAKNRHARTLHTTRMLEDRRQKEQIIALIQAADLGIVDISQKMPEPALLDVVHRVVDALRDELGPSEPDEMVVAAELVSLELSHQGQTGSVAFEYDDESLGTQVWLGLVGPVIQALADGSVLLADELDASLHPALVEELVRLFQSPSTNPRNAQLVFNSFDPDLLGDSVGERALGRDQVWFTEKLHDGATRLYPLSEFSPRRGESVARRYRDGRYGAVPIVSRQGFSVAAELVTSGAGER